MQTLLPSLVQLGTALGIAEEVLVRAETGRRLFLEVDVPCDMAREVSLDDFRSVLTSWGDAVSVRITSVYGIRELRVENGQIDEAAFANFSQDIREANHDETINVRITADKSSLLRRISTPQPKAPAVLYLFSSNLVRALDGGFEELKQLFFSDSAQCCCCVLDAPQFALSGPYYSVWGAAIFRSRYESFRPSHNARLREATDVRREQVSWLDFETELTPYQFVITSCTDATNPIHRAVVHLQSLLSVLYLADSVRQQNGVFLATFSGYERTDLTITRSAAEAVLPEASLARLFVWAYSGKAVDKLPTLRSVIAATLSGDREENYTLLVTTARRIFQTARSNYASFVAGFVTKYFDKLKEVDQHVRTAGKEIADRVADLVKTLTANLLATVGVAVGGFVAYALDKKSSPELLSIGLQVYGFYILIFPLGYSLILHGLVDFVITRMEFKRRTSDLETTLHVVGLTKKVRSELIGRTYHFWFVAISSAFVYALIAVICFWLSGIVSTPSPPTPTMGRPF